jgi:hypothetical protein
VILEVFDKKSRTTSKSVRQTAAIRWKRYLRDAEEE